MNKQKIYKLISILGATFLWGFWAYYVNHGTHESRLTSALCQGLISGLATSLMISALETLYQNLKSIIIPSLIVSSVTALSAIFIHYLIGTSEIIKTVSPAVCVSLIFSLITSYNLKLNTIRESV